MTCESITGAQLRSGFRRWLVHHRYQVGDAKLSDRVRRRAMEYVHSNECYGAFLKWTRFVMLRLKASLESDRRSIETAIAVSELEAVWGMELATYPEPDSSADCDECGRTNCYRYYHIAASADALPEDGDGLDLCERCYVGGEMAVQMAPELFASFTLVAPLIVGAEAWKDVADREKMMTQMVHAAKAADQAQKRSEMHLAARLFVGAANDARSLSEDGVTVEASFDMGTQQAQVPRNSRAAVLGARDPQQLGQAILSIINELKGAPQLSTLQLAIKAQLMVPASGDEVEPATPLYKILKDMGVGFSPRNPQQSVPLRHPLSYRQPMRPAPLAPLRASALTTMVAMQQRQPMPSHQATSDMETTFLMRQIGSTVASMKVSHLLQRHVRFSENAPLIPISLPAECRAAGLEPDELGEVLLNATRKAPSLNSARVALNALLSPPHLL